MDYDHKVESTFGEAVEPRNPQPRAGAPGRVKDVPVGPMRASGRLAGQAYDPAAATGRQRKGGGGSPERAVFPLVAPPQIAGKPRLLVYPGTGRGPGRKRAGKVFSESDLAHVLAHIEALSEYPESDRAMVLLTYRAGLRPCEVAGLRRRTLLTATGEIRNLLEVTGETAKRGKPRTIPMHPQLRRALVDLFEKYPEAEYVAIAGVSAAGFKYRSIANVTNRFAALYRGAGLHGCTGMSGRRSFATSLGRVAPPSLVQQALGHASLRMVEYYLRPTGDLAAAIQQLGSAE